MKTLLNVSTVVWKKNRKLPAYLRHEQIQFKESRMSGQERSRNISPTAQTY